MELKARKCKPFWFNMFFLHFCCLHLHSDSSHIVALFLKVSSLSVLCIPKNLARIIESKLFNTLKSAISSFFEGCQWLCKSIVICCWWLILNPGNEEISLRLGSVHNKKCVWLHVKKQAPLIFQCTSLTTQTFKWFMCDSIFVSRLFFYWRVYRKKMCLKVIFFFSGLTLFIFCLNNCIKMMLNLTKSLFIAVKINGSFSFSFKWQSSLWCMSDCPSEHVIFFFFCFRSCACQSVWLWLYPCTYTQVVFKPTKNSSRIEIQFFSSVNIKRVLKGGTCAFIL